MPTPQDIISKLAQAPTTRRQVLKGMAAGGASAAAPGAVTGGMTKAAGKKAVQNAMFEQLMRLKYGGRAALVPPPTAMGNRMQMRAANARPVPTAASTMKTVGKGLSMSPAVMGIMAALQPSELGNSELQGGETPYPGFR